MNVTHNQYKLDVPSTIGPPIVLRRRMMKSSTEGISSVARLRACSTCEFIQLSTARKNLHKRNVRNKRQLHLTP